MIVGIPIETDSQGDIADIEEIGSGKRPRSSPNLPMSTKRRRLNTRNKDESEFSEEDLAKPWRDVLGDPPQMGSSKVCRNLFGNFCAVFTLISSLHHIV